jgi:hypothetical protein
MHRHLVEKTIKTPISVGADISVCPKILGKPVPSPCEAGRRAVTSRRREEDLGEGIKCNPLKFVSLHFRCNVNEPQIAVCTIAKEESTAIRVH